MLTQLNSPLLTVSINSSGAEISSVKNKSGLEFMWQAKKEIWPRHAPVLFPIVGKLKDNEFLFRDRSYTLGQHGFARDRDFELVKSNNFSCTFQLQSDTKSKEVYPFDFIFQIKYELKENKLITSYKIINPSDVPIFFSIGAHPGFNCPLLETENFEDYFLEFESSDFSITELNNGLKTITKRELLLKNHKLQLTKHLFDEDALVFENNQINKITLCSSKSIHKIGMECKNWPYFGVWSKKGGAAFVCLEPWYGIADSETTSKNISAKEGIISLEPQNEFNCSFSITFE